MSGASELGAEKPTRKGPEPLRSRQRGVLEDVDRSPCSKDRARSRAQSSKACWGPVAARVRTRRAENGTSRERLYAFTGSTYRPTFTRPGRMTRPRKA